MADMLVKLYDLRLASNAEVLRSAGIRIVRALAVDKPAICEFIRQSFDNPGWVAECEVTLSRQPVSCFIAVHNGNVVGFACYDATAKGMLAPIGVRSDWRGKGIATELLGECLLAMRNDGYAYAVIGWVGSEAFYARACGAIPIPDSAPGVYSRMIRGPTG